MIVALAGAAMAEVFAVVSLSNTHLAAGNDGSGQRCSKQISVLEDGVALQSSGDGFLDKLALEILADKGLGTELQNDIY